MSDHIPDAGKMDTPRMLLILAWLIAGLAIFGHAYAIIEILKEAP
jgi:hypothetical protein